MNDFEAQDQIAVQRLAVRDNEHATATQATSDALLHALLERLAYPTIVIDCNYHILRCNQSAKELTESGHVLTCAGGELSATTDALALELKGFLDQVLGIAESSEPYKALTIELDATGQTYQIWGARLTEPAAPLVRASAIIVVINPAEPNSIPLRVLQSMFGLTETESKLTEAVLKGLSVEQFAEKSKMSLNTARTHLKAIFYKTKTHRQVDLVRLLSQTFLKLDGDICVEEGSATVSA